MGANLPAVNPGRLVCLGSRPDDESTTCAVSSGESERFLHHNRHQSLRLYKYNISRMIYRLG